jgi:hypothetical protein
MESKSSLRVSNPDIGHAEENTPVPQNLKTSVFNLHSWRGEHTQNGTFREVRSQPPISRFFVQVDPTAFVNTRRRLFNQFGGHHARWLKRLPRCFPRRYLPYRLAKPCMSCVRSEPRMPDHLEMKWTQLLWHFHKQQSARRVVLPWKPLPESFERTQTDETSPHCPEDVCRPLPMQHFNNTQCLLDLCAFWSRH